MSYGEPSKFVMQLPGASHPQVLTGGRSVLSAQRTRLDLSCLLGLHTSVTSPGIRYLSIFLSQSIMERQQQGDELNSSTLNEPEVTSMQ